MKLTMTIFTKNNSVLIFLEKLHDKNSYLMKNKKFLNTKFKCFKIHYNIEQI